MVFICVILVLYGFYGLTVRESIVFTFWGSAFQLFCCFAGMWIITMAATVSLLGGSMMNARIIACQLFAIAMWMLIIDVAGVTESTQLLAGFFLLIMYDICHTVDCVMNSNFST
uniref:Uncharacterized protein n=1 Tax=Klebsiella pneumoniae TaxID=573 RepID=A0A2P1BPY4_KLEPN|nr:hypothetical protein [Klebsiella pneumoniae]